MPSLSSLPESWGHSMADFTNDQVFYTVKEAADRTFDILKVTWEDVDNRAGPHQARQRVTELTREAKGLDPATGERPKEAVTIVTP